MYPMTIILNDPKFPHNVGQIVRAASAFGVSDVLMTGTRVSLEGAEGYRLPREERMRGRYKVDVRRHHRPIDELAPGVTPVAVELVPGAADITWFEHPEHAAYVFGPEDGHLAPGLKAVCHQFIYLPMQHCANLSATVWMVLFDRHTKRVRAGLELPLNLRSEELAAT